MKTKRYEPETKCLKNFDFFQGKQLFKLLRKFFLGRSFKTLFLYCAGIFLFFNAIFTAFAQNMIKNGTFDDGISDWRKAEWIKNSLNLKWDNSKNVGAGLGAAQFECSKDKKGLYSQYIPFISGVKKYKISAWLKCDSLRRGRASVFIRTTNMKENLWSCSTPLACIQGGTHEWKQYIGEFSLPDGQEFMYVYLAVWNSDGGSCWFDNIVLEPLSSEKQLISSEKLSQFPRKSKLSPIDLLAEGEWGVEGNGVCFKEFEDKLFFKVNKGDFYNILKYISPINISSGFYRFSGIYKGSKTIRPDININIFPKTSKPIVHKVVFGNEQNKATPFSIVFHVDPDVYKINITLKSSRFKEEGISSIENMRLEKMVIENNLLSILHWDVCGKQSLFYKKDNPAAVMYFENGFNKEIKIPIKFNITDYFGKIVGYFKKEFSFPPLSINKEKIEFPKQDKLGFYAVTAIWENNGVSEHSKISFVVVDKELEKPDHFFGFTPYFISKNDYSTLRMLGAGSVHAVMWWNNGTDKNCDGKYNWDRLDQEITECINAGLIPIGGFYNVGRSTIPLKHYTIREKLNKEGKYPYTQEYFDDAKHFQQAVVERYKSHIKVWSMIAEINLLVSRTGSEYEYDHYVRFAKGLYTAVKTADPAAIVLGIGVSGKDGREFPRFPFVREMWNQYLYRHLDGLGLDQYTTPFTYGPGYFPATSENGCLKEILKEAAEIVKSKDKKYIAIMEKGYNIPHSLPVDSPYSMQLANTLAREYLISKSIPEMICHLYFAMRRSSINRTLGVVGNLDWGMWKDKFPRPAAASFAAISRLFAHTTFVRTIDFHKDIPCYLFQKIDGTYLAALWNTNRVSSSIIMTPPEGKKIRGFDVQGNSFLTQKELCLTDAPVYLDLGRNPEKWEKAFYSSDITLPEFQFEIIPEQSNRFLIGIRRLCGAKSKVRVSLEEAVDNNDIELEISQGEISYIPVTVVERPFKIWNKNGANLKLTTSKGRKYEYQQNLVFYPIYRVKKDTEVKKLPALELKDPLYISDVDAVSNRLWTGDEDLSAEVRLGYDQEYFYIHANVKDDFHWNNRIAAHIWNGDSLQMAFDTLLVSKKKHLEGKIGICKGYYNFAAALLNSDAPVFYCYSAGEINKSMEKKKIDIPLDIIRNEKNRTTEYFIKIPWKNLEPLKPEKNRCFGFNFLFFDSDKDSETPQYWMQLRTGIANGVNPYDYAVFVFE